MTMRFCEKWYKTSVYFILSFSLYPYPYIHFFVTFVAAHLPEEECGPALIELNIFRNKLMKRSLLMMVTGCMLTTVMTAATPISGNDVALKFNPATGSARSLTLPNGKTVKYQAYEKIYYVGHVEDSAYQYLNFYVPQSAEHSQTAPIFLRTYVGGYMASQAMTPSADDATGRALAEGYVVCIPGARGSNSVVTTKKGKQVYTGRIPAGLLDLKAAVRYLRYNDAAMAGNAERIITDGTSAGGAMSALLGATGNYPAYEPYLKEMKAASARDNVFAAVCYCPITDLNHADMAYEWLYGNVKSATRPLTAEQQRVSKLLSEAYPDYLNSLKLTDETGRLLTADNYRNYLKQFIIASAQRARNEGCNIPDSIGFKFYTPSLPQGFGAMGMKPNKLPLDGRAAPSFGPGGGMHFAPPTSDFIVDVDLDKYLNYVATTQALKTPPAFDAKGVAGGTASAENRAFGDAKGSAVNFTTFSLREATGKNTATLPADLAERVRIINPMNFITDSAATKAPHWFIRHGARDRDTSFPVPVNLATKLKNAGLDVNFFLPWNRPHSGDYNLDDLFNWLKEIVK